MVDGATGFTDEDTKMTFKVDARLAVMNRDQQQQHEHHEPHQQQTAARALARLTTAGSATETPGPNTGSGGGSASSGGSSSGRGVPELAVRRRRPASPPAKAAGSAEARTRLVEAQLAQSHQPSYRAMALGPHFEGSPIRGLSPPRTR